MPPQTAAEHSRPAASSGIYGRDHLPMEIDHMRNLSSRRRLALALSVSLSLLATPLLRAEDKATAEKKPVAVTPMPKSSPKDPKVEKNFIKRHEGFLKDKEEALKNGPVQLVFLGDSITDGWRKTDKEKGDSPQFKLFKERWGTKYNALNLGIGGDRTEHVLWRLDQGEVDGLKPKALMLMIGTNNLGNNQSPEDTILGVTAIVKELREKLPETKILLLAVFPPRQQARRQVPRPDQAGERGHRQARRRQERQVPRHRRQVPRARRRVDQGNHARLPPPQRQRLRDLGRRGGAVA
jgi:lysophospholipase L1-like esterase